MKTVQSTPFTIRIRERLKILAQFKKYNLLYSQLRRLGDNRVYINRLINRIDSNPVLIMNKTD